MIKSFEKVNFLFNDDIQELIIEEEEIKKVITKQTEIKNPFVVYGIGIQPNIEPFKETLKHNRGILVDRKMRESESIFAVGECAKLKENGFIAGHVMDAQNQADVVLATLKGEESFFVESIRSDHLKTSVFSLTDISTAVCDYDEVLLYHKENTFNQFFLKESKLVRYIGINSHPNALQISTMMLNDFHLDALSCNYSTLICNCTNQYEDELTQIIEENYITQFKELSDYSDSGRVCGSCKKEVQELIKRVDVSPEEAKKHKKLVIDPKIEKIKKRLHKLKRLHPNSDENLLEKSFEAYELSSQELNQWVSMIAANMRLHQSFENIVYKGNQTLNKIPIIWLELSYCSGNSEAFIKSYNPSVEDLILDYVSLDYHELIMGSAGNRSEMILEEVQKEGNYVLIVEGAIPLGDNGNFLKINGKTGTAVLKEAAENAAMILAVGSCALDGGVVVAYPNPTNAAGVRDVLSDKRVINLPGCPVNPINIVGTLLHYLMLEELPELDKLNRPTWAYQYRIHDNCERRGHYELEEFVQEWGDEGAKKGWCLFKMGCKGPNNYSLVKFNAGASWVIESGHGCIACSEEKFFDKYANEREMERENEENCH